MQHKRLTVWLILPLVLGMCGCTAPQYIWPQEDIQAYEVFRSVPTAGNGFQGDAEGVFLVAATDVDMPGVGGLVHQFIKKGVDFVQFSHSEQCISTEVGAHDDIRVVAICI